MVTKKRSGKHPSKKNQNSSPDTSSQTNSSPNVHSISQESDALAPAKDINQKLSSLEQTLENLETRFYLSHEEFEQILSGVNNRTDVSNADIKELQVQLSKINSNYQVLDTQSGRLVKETGRLALLIDKLNVDKLEAIGEFEQQLIERFESTEKKIVSLDKALKQSDEIQQKTSQSLKTEVLKAQKISLEYLAEHKSQLDKQTTDIKQLFTQSDQNQAQSQAIQQSISTQEQALQEVKQSLTTELHKHENTSEQHAEKIELLLSSAVSATKQRESISTALTEQHQQLNKRIDETNLKNSSAQQFLDRKQRVLVQQTEDMAAEPQAIPTNTFKHD